MHSVRVAFDDLKELVFQGALRGGPPLGVPVEEVLEQLQPGARGARYQHVQFDFLAFGKTKLD